MNDMEHASSAGNVRIKTVGYEQYVREMHDTNRQTIKK